ncbi:MAG: hypothetical protein EPN25_01270 [Nitrospirae bacterium]|nr:MAG: hypothetical protein EPN25_01270 [Nitrospirota bacterium]
MMKKPYRDIIILIVSAVLLAGWLPVPVQAGTVVVKPGQFDHFSLQLPDKSIAGENFIVRVQAFDLNNNLITNFIESGKEFKIDVSGSAAVQPSTLNASSFSGGAANISVNCKKAERLIISIRESGGTVPVISRELIVSPNKLEHFVLQAPATVKAGTRFDMRIIAKDLFDNTVDDVEIGRNLKITSSGTANPVMVSSAAIDFKNGTATATFVSEKAGATVIELQEISGGSRGRSNEVSVTPGSLSSFKVQAPKAAVAGEAFDLLVSAYDAYDNLITNYATAGAGVSLLSTGSTKIEPSFLAPSDFKGGQAVVRAVYDKAEDITVIAKDVNSEKSGKTAEIQISNASPDHFVVVTPDMAVSGQRFKIKIEAYDRFNNIVRNFNISGNEVLLSTTGTSFINPSIIVPTDFINGIAMIDVTYDKAESFTLSAKMISDKRQPKMTISEKVPAKEAAQPVQQASGRKEEKPVPVKKDVKPEPKKETAAPAEPRKKPEAETRPAEKPVRTAKVQKPAAETKPSLPAEKPPVKPAEAKKPEVKQAAEQKPDRPAEAVRTPQEPLKKEEKKGEHTTAVSKIAAIEAKSKAMLVINLSDVGPQFEYSDSVVTRGGKEWLSLSMKPAVRKTEKVFKFKSAFMGEVQVEDDKSGQNALTILIELLPTGVTFDVERIKNTLIVTLSKP